MLLLALLDWYKDHPSPELKTGRLTAAMILRWKSYLIALFVLIE
jgi:hypothetical protein